MDTQPDGGPMTRRRERPLVHGPCLADLTDFLYFDRVVYPSVRAMVRPVDLPPGYIGYEAQEPLPEAIRERLATSGLIVAPGVLLLPSAEEIIGGLASWAGGVGDGVASMPNKNGALLGELMLPPMLRLPAKDHDVRVWLEGLDALVKKLADGATAVGRAAVPKLHAQDAFATLKPGWDRMLCITFDDMPCLMPGPGGLEERIAFLGDETLHAKRAALFEHCLEVAADVHGSAPRAREVVEQIEALLRDFIDMLRSSGMVVGERTFESIFAAPSALIDALVAVPAPADRFRGFRFGARGLNFGDTAPPPPGTELAYVTHASRDWRGWFPMVG